MLPKLLLASLAVTSGLLPAFAQNQAILTPEFSSFVDGVLAKFNLPGVSISVSRKDGTSELGAWGIRTEDGEQMTPDVCPPFYLPIHIAHLTFH